MAKRQAAVLLETEDSLSRVWRGNHSWSNNSNFFPTTLLDGYLQESTLLNTEMQKTPKIKAIPTLLNITIHLFSNS